MSRGGIPIDVTDLVHPDNRKVSAGRRPRDRTRDCWRGLSFTRSLQSYRELVVNLGELARFGHWHDLWHVGKFTTWESLSWTLYSDDIRPLPAVAVLPDRQAIRSRLFNAFSSVSMPPGEGCDRGASLNREGFGIAAADIRRTSWSTHQISFATTVDLSCGSCRVPSQRSQAWVGVAEV